MPIKVKENKKNLNGRMVTRWRVYTTGENGEIVNISQVLKSKQAVYKNIFAAADEFRKASKDKNLIQFILKKK